jgi:hypothetical protein
MSRRLLSLSDRLVVRAAHGMTRRRMFRNVGGAALGASFATALGGTGLAYAHPDHACGPSPMCPDARCQDGDKQRCAGGRADTTWRRYNGTTCTGFLGSLSAHCWTAQAHGETYRCCDCCVRGTALSGRPCSGCSGGGWQRCICGKRIS